MVAMLQQVGRRSATAAAKVFVECRLAYDDTCFVPCVPENPNFAFAAHENSQTSMQLDAYLWRYGDQREKFTRGIKYLGSRRKS